MLYHPDTKHVQALLVDRGINHFSAEEVVRFGMTHNGVQNGFPDRRFWHNIIPTLQIVEQLRDYFGGRPVGINSGWRSPPYNEAVGGEKNSFHMRFNALDCVFPAAPYEVHRYLVDQKLDRWMGIGVYNTFVHLDTRRLVFGSFHSFWAD